MTYTENTPDGTILGHVPGISPGTFFRDRQELHEKQLHRGLMRGIAPHRSSIVLSGGYVNDEDMGNVIIYTGEGRRDPNTGRQVAEQQLILVRGRLLLRYRSKGAHLLFLRTRPLRKRNDG
jgi:putative restriction endonuclease